jgi:hypothetical protein
MGVGEGGMRGRDGGVNDGLNRGQRVGRPAGQEDLQLRQSGQGAKHGCVNCSEGGSGWE